MLLSELRDAENRSAGPITRAGTALAASLVALGSGLQGTAQDTNAFVAEQKWNWHAQNTYIVQGDPGFPAEYSGPNSLNSVGERQSTITADLFAGVRLWRGAEAHVDGMMWQGFGLSKTLGVEEIKALLLLCQP